MIEYHKHDTQTFSQVDIFNPFFHVAKLVL
jgi:hypothetical protein